MSRKPAQSLQSEQRAAQRFTLLLRVGKLVTPAGEFLCVLRDVSDRGIKARLFHDLLADQGCELELNDGVRYRLERVWQRDDHAGFRFAESSIDIHQLIEETGPFPKRHIRVRLKRSMPVLLSFDGLTLVAQLSDISQHGAAVTLDGRLAIGQQLRLDAIRLPALHARVLWRRRMLHGLVFQEGFRLDALAALAGQIQLGDEQGRSDGYEAAKSPSALTGD